VSAARDALDLLAEAARRWSRDAGPRLAAAVSFYTVLSIVPLLVVILAVAGALFGPAVASSELELRLLPVLGEHTTQSAARLLRQATGSEASLPASLASFAILAYAASNVFAQLKGALDVMWGLPERRGRVGYLVRTRLVAFALVAATGILLVASVLADAARAIVVAWLGKAIELPIPQGETALSYALLAVLVGLVFKVLPDTTIRWKDVAVGALFTTVLLVAGMRLLGFYFSYRPFTSIYGAAASIVALLLWVHYSSMVFLYGAEFTHVWATRHGEPTETGLEEVGVA
jgi:membrane protein